MAVLGSSGPATDISLGNHVHSGTSVQEAVAGREEYVGTAGNWLRVRQNDLYELGTGIIIGSGDWLCSGQLLMRAIDGTNGWNSMWARIGWYPYSGTNQSGTDPDFQHSWSYMHPAADPTRFGYKSLIFPPKIITVPSGSQFWPRMEARSIGGLTNPLVNSTPDCTFINVIRLDHGPND